MVRPMAEGGDQTSATPALRVNGRRFRRRRRVALGVACAVLAALVALWIARKPIAARLIDDALAVRHVAARYTISDLGFGRQRMTDVVIGDPASPDLVADWIETDTRIGLDGPVLTGVRVGRARLRGRIADGRLSLGELDKLMPAPSGKPFALPALRAAIDDARMRLETPWGVLGVKIAGRGRLDDGFAGTAALVGRDLAAAGCTVGSVATVMRIRVVRAAPRLTGPARLTGTRCGGASIARVGSDIDVRLSPALDHWTGSSRLAASGVATPFGEAASLQGSIRFDGSMAATTGRVDLAAGTLRSAMGRAATAQIAGAYRIGATQDFAGTVRLGAASVSPQRLAWLDPRATAGTPLAPLAAAAVRAVQRGARRFDADGVLALKRDSAGMLVRATRVRIAAASGGRLQLRGGEGVAFSSAGRQLRLDTRLSLAGGGLPRLEVTLAQARAGAPIRGRATLEPYAADGARLALTPVIFSATPAGATRVTTQADISGPVGDGRVEGLTLPIDLVWDGRDALSVNRGCAPVGLRALTVAGLSLAPLTSRLCPVDGAMVRLTAGRIGGGVAIAATRLGGRLGQTPLTVALRAAVLRLGTQGFAVDGVAARIGNPERVTRIDIGRLGGRIAQGGVAGDFADGAGQIGNVPLLLGGAAGSWAFRDGILALDGTMTVSDAAAAPRFVPQQARGVTLRLADGAISAKGTLFEATQNVKVADVAIGHQLSSGQGRADVSVPGIAFTKAFQPELLTGLTRGVVAEVRGTVTGGAHLDWTPEGVRSTGTFGTTDMALAAALGPVSGITTTIRFTDLLALESAPAQVATIRTINPGIAVTDGTIVYRLLANQRVAIAGGTWPFAGGRMTLLPTTLDFAQERAKAMTFRLDGVEADRFLSQFDFKNLNATGIFDGELPMVFDADGGRIANGRLAVREGGGSLAYVGDLTQKDLGVWGNIAFQALKSLRYRSLTIAMNGPLAGEMITDVRFAGVTQGQGAKSNFIVRRLQRLPFVFNVRIKAPFRGLLDSAQSFYDPSRLVRRNLPALLDRQRGQQTTPIQPPASVIVP